MKNIYIKNLVSGSMFKIVNILLNLISVPLLLKTFGKTNYGTYALIFSFLAYIQLVNFGIPRAISVNIVKIQEKEKKIAYIKKAFKILLVMSFIFFVISFILVRGIFLELTPTDGIFFLIEKEVKLVLYCVPLLTIFSVDRSLYFGFQKLYLFSISNLFQLIFKFLIVLITFWKKETLLFYLALYLFNEIFFKISRCLYFNYKVENFFKKNATFDYKIYEIIKESFKFLISSISMLIILNTDNFVIGSFLDRESVTEFNLNFKVISILMSFVYVITGSLTPILMGKAGNNDFLWIENKNKEMQEKITVFSTFLGIGTINLIDPFLVIWSQGLVSANLYVVIFFIGYLYMYGKNNILCDIMISIDRINEVSMIMFLEGIINLSISIFLIKKIGISGVAIGTFLGALSTNYLYSLRIKTKTEIKLSKFSILSKKNTLLLLISIFIKLCGINNFYSYMFLIVEFFIFIKLNIKSVKKIIILKYKI